MDELVTYRVPFSAEAEQSVIGAMLIDGRCVPDILQVLDTSDFHHELNRNIFKSISTMFDAGGKVDPVLICDKLECGDFTREEAHGYVVTLFEATPTAANALDYAKIVKKHSLLRAVQAASLEAIQTADGGDLEEIHGALQRVLDSVEDQGSAKAVSLTDAAVALWRELQYRCADGKTVSGLKTGYDDLDRLLGGLRPGNMIVLAARSGMGKSALALNIATETAKINRCPILIFSLEMGYVELAERVFARYADLDLSRIRDAQLDTVEWRKMADTASRITPYAVRIVEASTMDISDITRICRREKPAAVIIDHIGLVRPSGKYRDRREAVDGISRSIKQLAKDLSVPIIAVAQLNRAIMGRANKKPLLSDLRESGAIEQDADSVLLIHRPSYFNEDSDKTAASLIIAKNRNGKTGTVPLRWSGSRQHFIAEWRDEVESEYLQEELPC